VDALFNGAVALESAGRHEDAARYYDRILALDPGAVDAALGLARSLFLLGRADDAAASLRRALQRAPESPELTAMLAEIERTRRETH
jgi:tetratricopeptide (TPR) repeat protein